MLSITSSHTLTPSLQVGCVNNVIRNKQTTRRTLPVPNYNKLCQATYITDFFIRKRIHRIETHFVCLFRKGIIIYWFILGAGISKDGCRYYDFFRKGQRALSS